MALVITYYVKECSNGIVTYIHKIINGSSDKQVIDWIINNITDQDMIVNIKWCDKVLEYLKTTIFNRTKEYRRVRVPEVRMKEIYSRKEKELVLYRKNG